MEMPESKSSGPMEQHEGDERMGSPWVRVKVEHVFLDHLRQPEDELFANYILQHARGFPNSSRALNDLPAGFPINSPSLCSPSYRHLFQD